MPKLLFVRFFPFRKIFHSDQSSFLLRLHIHFEQTIEICYMRQSLPWSVCAIVNVAADAGLLNGGSHKIHFICIQMFCERRHIQHTCVYL